MMNNLGMEPRDMKSKGLRGAEDVSAQWAAAVVSAHSALNVLELPESESKLNASNAFVFWNLIEVPCRRT